MIYGRISLRSFWRAKFKVRFALASTSPSFFVMDAALLRTVVENCGLITWAFIDSHTLLTELVLVTLMLHHYLIKLRLGLLSITMLLFKMYFHFFRHWRWTFDHLRWTNFFWYEFLFVAGKINIILSNLRIRATSKQRWLSGFYEWCYVIILYWSVTIIFRISSFFKFWTRITKRIFVWTL